MNEELDSHLRRYRATREPEALGGVFDLAAPRLMRLAIHLVGEPAEAEDLVQATFLTVLERSASYDPKRGAWPWLVGILGNKARGRKREAARDFDPGRLLDRAVATPLDEALELELSADLARAIDTIDEPYRQALLLRLRHGLAPADIAHTLGESPTAIRTRLSRGFEKLRARLPRSHASALALFLVPERGLEAVRAHVLSVARATRTIPAAPTLAGKLVQAKTIQLVLGASALFVALGVAASWTVALRRPSAPAGLVGQPDPDSLVPERPPGRPEALGANAELRAATREPTRVLVSSRGRVLDGLTREPLPGATVEFHPLRETTLAAAMRMDGRRAGLELSPLGSVPALAEPLGERQRLGLEPVRVHARPAVGAVAQASTLSGPDGGFELEVPPEGGTLSVALEGFGRRAVALHHPGREHELELFPERRLFGYVVDAEGRRWSGSLGLYFHDDAGSAWRTNPITAEPIEVSAGECWSVRTNERGEFDVLLPCEAVRASSATPGIALATRGVHPARGELWEYRSLHRTGEPEPAILVAVPGLALHVTEAATGAPVERFFLSGKRSFADSPIVTWSGLQFAPGGFLVLRRTEDDLRGFEAQPIAVEVWTESLFGHARILDPASEGLVEVVLEPRPLLALDGTVLRGGEAVEKARVTLLPHDRVHRRERAPLGLASTDAEGAFALAAPEGIYLLAVEHGDEALLERVALPLVEPLVLDLGGLVELVVEVRDAAGTPCIRHGVHVEELSNGERTGRGEVLLTDARGRASFHSLSPGRHRVHVSRTPTDGSYSQGIVEELTLTPGAERLHVVEVPMLEPSRARVVTDEPVDLTRWRARSHRVEPVALRADGTVPIDLSRLAFPFLILEDEEQREFRFDLSRDTRDGHVLHLELAGPRYEGRVLGMETGQPEVGLRVEARSPSSSYRISALTDEDGEFELPCWAPEPHVLSFRRAGVAHWPFPRGLDFVFHETDTPPALDPEPLRIELPRVDADDPPRGEPLRVRVLTEGSGEPRANARVSTVWTTLGGVRAGKIWEGGITAAGGACDVFVHGPGTITLHVFTSRDSPTPVLTRELTTPVEQDEVVLYVPAE